MAQFLLTEFLWFPTLGSIISDISLIILQILVPTLLQKMRFFNFFLNHMVQKYQNEIAPTFYYGISTKTNEKDLKIPNLQPPD